MKRSGSDSRPRGLLVSLAGLALGLIAWQVAGQRDPVLLATPVRSVEALAAMVSDGTLPAALLDTGLLFVAGLAAAIVGGVGYGLVLSRSRALRGSTGWLVFAFQSVPIVALAPLILAAFGFGFGAKTLVVFLSAVFPILINTAEGAKHAPRTLLEVARVHRSGEWPLWRDVLIPHTLPYAMSGIRQGIAMAFVGTFIAEFFLQATGIGGLLLSASARFDSATVLGLTVLVSVLAALLMGLGRRLERAFAPWREGSAE
ncbi:ABC transporter permease [Herbidospora cretacea]|uniref:ABC transporter permease n=1 Tax=Herbidospora cretacea TaxID=28444 RepID=UPI00068B429A|nr:ABC transporter permease [Herbidospora cretacea]